MELLDIVDEYGVPTGKIVERSIAHAEGIRHRTAHVWLLRRRNGTVELLLQKRCAEKDSFPGCYDISSAGHIPAGCDFAESAIRELEEELGVAAAPEDLIFCGDRSISTDNVFFGTPYHDRQYSRVFALWEDRDADDFAIQRTELESVQWMEFDAVCSAVAENCFPHCICSEELEMLRKAFFADSPY